MKCSLVGLAPLGLALFGLPAGPARAAEAPVDFDARIRPLFEAHCVACHGPQKQKGGLRLDVPAAILKGGDTGPALIPRDAAGSLMIRLARGTHPDFPRMPPTGDPLAEPDIQLLEKWIGEGAATSAPGAPAPAAAALPWGYRMPVRVDPPAVSDEAWPRNPIDRFVMARLDREGARPAPEASRETLIRRAGLDIIGLPPTAEELEAFLADAAPDAYERLVDRLLDSPHRGERDARRWLDLARYADSNGYSIDGPREIWRYRDWVINALNADMPYDQFIVEQLAGDLLPGSTLDQKIATGFHRNTMFNQEGGVDVEEFRIEAVIDRVNTTGAALLGLTVGCAQCHNHKFDPISQREYYQLFAFFNQDDEAELPVASAEEVGLYEAVRAQRRALETELADYQKRLARGVKDWEKSLAPERAAKLNEKTRAALAVPDAERNDEQRGLLMEAFRKDDPGHAERRKTIDDLKKREPKLPTTLALAARPARRPTFVHLRGDFTRKGDPVEPGVPAALGEPLAAPAAGEGAPLTRLDLARWIANPANPLAARVEVNRIWQAFFGRGIVETENDFGAQSSGASNPELLDWLATEFMARGWSRKAIMRLIATSATYRMSSITAPEMKIKDPTNQLLARQSRIRLDAEIVRDNALAASGLLSSKIGGPGVFPPQPDGVTKLGQVARDWKPSAGEDRYRRGMYTYFWRGTPHPALTVFDAPRAVETCTRRVRSNTPLQALTLLNDEAFAECASFLAERIQREAPPDADGKIRRAVRLCLARDPDADELAVLRDLAPADSGLTGLMSLAARGEGSGAANPSSDAPRSWLLVARTLLNMDEFITRE